MKLKISILLISVVTLLSAHVAHAVEISPTKLDLSISQTKNYITLTNTRSSAIVFKNEVVQWTKNGRDEKFTPTNDILVAPPITTIPANSKQIIRVGLTRPTDPDKELTYRLRMQEVPPPPAPNFKGVRIILRITVPIYVAPDKVVKNQLNWTATEGHNHKSMIITCNNNNNVHQNLNRLILKDEKEVELASQETQDNVLFPHQSQQWTIPIQNSTIPATIHLTAETDVGNINVAIPVQRS